MKKHLVMFFLLLCSIASGQVSGTIVDFQNEAVPFANVILKTAQDSNLVDGTQTDDRGHFKFTVDNGKYFIEVSYLSFKEYSSVAFEVNAVNPKVNLPLITLEEESYGLEEVQITAKKMLIQQTAEGKTINVKGSVMTRGSNALQVLERSPGVFVDQRNGGLSLNGQSGVRILINGRDTKMSNADLLNYLSALSGDNIKNIELLTNPSAKYGADGSAGIININISKGKMDHTNGSYTINSGYGFGPKYGINGNVNTKIKNVNIQSSYAHFYDNQFSQWEVNGDQNVPILGGYQKVHVFSENEVTLRNHNLNLSLDTDLSDKLLVGASLNYILSGRLPEGKNNTRYSYPDPEENLHSIIRNKTNNKSQNMIGNLFSEYKFTPKDKLTIDLSYLGFQNQNPSIVNSVFLDQYGEEKITENPIFVNEVRGENRTTIDVGVAQIDYESQLPSKLKLESGLKFSASYTQNQAATFANIDGIWTEDLRFANQNALYENIYAAYSSISYPIDSLTSLNIGLRYEHWTRNFENAGVEDQNTGKFFPSIFLTRKVAENQNINLSYTKRITRPNFNDLATFSHYNGPVSVFSGNPLLQATIADKYSISYQFRTLNVGVNYEDISNQIIFYQLVTNATNDLFIVSPQNAFEEDRLNLELSYSGNISPWWNVSSGGTLSSRSYKIDYSVTPAEKKYNTYTLWTNQTLDLPRSFCIELSGWYNGAFYEGTKRINGFGMLNGGLKKNLKKGSLQFSVSDVLKSMSVYSSFGSVTPEIFNTTSDVLWESESALYRVFRLSYSRNFGISKSSRSRKITEEERRVVN